MNKLLLITLFFSAGIQATSVEKALQYTTSAYEHYEATLQQCMDGRSPNILLTQDEIKTLSGIPYSEEIIPYLEERAFALCTLEEKMLYTEALILLEKLHEKQPDARVAAFIHQHKQDNFHLIELEIKINYMKLSPQIREKLGSVATLHKPFNGVALQQIAWPDAK
ncbi:MAG: hypothetical protein CVV11_10735 [Gammaproteobacteria bacterium HGW-Gammaproteobacteria-15]|nr:MAG: hypothetical protein CVV11_10735 [Gammaproteobacteria bacterium HGW-Gammaproteobacteria-15]